MSKFAIVTGAAGGIGLDCSIYLNEMGWSVIGLDVKEIKYHNDSPFLSTFKVDISVREELFDCLRYLEDRGISLSAIINNAAIQIEKGILHITESEWDLVMAVNLKSVLFTTQVFSKLMANSSSIVNISSVHARATSQNLCAYVASKGALSALTRAMALELSEKGIRVNAILPGAVDTEMLKSGLLRSGNEKSAMNRLRGVSPLGKIGTGKDIARLIWFLADGEMSSNITGQEFVTDSGVLARLASE